MSGPMMRLVVFAIVVLGLYLYFYLVNRPREPREASVKKAKRREKSGIEFWLQVYDTDAIDEARRIQVKFNDVGIQCVISEQGKKDVFGNTPKHYAVSVPRDSADRAQAILSKLAL